MKKPHIKYIAFDIDEPCIKNWKVMLEAKHSKILDI